ncbi:4a-hydroxytetrahydrobiopterin dehydratase [Tabrizicola sp.]|uniref:4a-hydroxytetrahydrobiopterin dehydratase n=1 Tax=Tabrizicola sp. TaxID=2005166 RepID=UPI00273514DD|nr:4a-hydroxytetrahydrobiopterin dehydratase [Tabrizicola sp.]MDP3194761.1 4a-hydroxytetrahydrobiopterin dehydratase [Tabrizicola sp.]MDZ4065633.1 4a-hydroxytetrahydrobiopterin dehydratase [Tabrizicola sp.]
MERLDADACGTRMKGLQGDWVLDAAAGTLTRSFAFKGFAKPVQLANLVAWHAEKIGHHPDICLGWGYVRVTWTTHDAGGLTGADFAAAEGLDRLLA